MPAKVFYGSPVQSRLDASETLPCKLDKILDALHLRDRVKGETVAIKMHLGGNVGYSTIHPVFVRRVVKAVLDGGGKPFVCDLAGAVATAAQRGYTPETLGCPIYPTGGPDEKYFYTHIHEYKNLREWRLGGMIADATFLIDLAHVKGHPSCGFGAAIKNLALGAMMAPTRSAIHDACHFDRYWFSEKCPDAAIRKKIIDSCPFEAIVEDKNSPDELHLHYEMCNQCGRCLKVAPEGSLYIRPENFWAFQEACAISAKIVLSTFEPGKAVFINIATQIHTVCDCFGFTGQAIMPDLGVFGSDDIVAVDTAVLDMAAKETIRAESLPLAMELQPNAGHPFQQVHGPYKDPYKAPEYLEKLGCGTREYELVDVMPARRPEKLSAVYIPAS
ncbi:MAG: DUF362 domain-containing protein [Candidatus Hydrogenedentota bacterium]|jgi:uncharacterized Fe-S center protein|uniref:Ferredoxin n=1 Tax=Sumerlaea chitinivorans TaxID=2250252 RepID=A0A2Z4Y827_SUMC1|nr:Ferredoxin [Candidatus Sumerlaea chitinivorans]RMH31301.1 MAG: DUF362 domain-containing protein [Candidatus Hydrogenedentota bacterium]GIX45494.1 MAG: 4Fe-4S ferredoxin [Candidatus Sumerlaea sp.]